MNDNVANSEHRILELEDIVLNFGGLMALDHVSAVVEKPEILAVIGPNGAGKTSVFNCVTGFYHPQGGNIYFNGLNITQKPPFKIAKLGIARTFQNIGLYNGLSAIDNLMAARHIFMKSDILTGAIYFGRTKKEEIKNRRVAEEIIDFLEIHSVRKQIVANLPYGIRKRIDLGRALALNPKLLLLDEPMAGMNVEEKEAMARFIIDIYETMAIPIVLVEHDMSLVMDIADRIIVLDVGSKIAEGRPESIIKNEKVISAYLGVKETQFAEAK